LLEWQVLETMLFLWVRFVSFAVFIGVVLFSPYVVSLKATCQENSKLLLVCCQNHRLCLPDKLVLIKEGCLNRYMAIVTSCLDQYINIWAYMSCMYLLMMITWEKNKWLVIIFLMHYAVCCHAFTSHYFLLLLQFLEVLLFMYSRCKCLVSVCCKEQWVNENLLPLIFFTVARNEVSFTLSIWMEHKIWNGWLNFLYVKGF